MKVVALVRVLALVLSLVAAAPAQAHLMVAQRGTLNLVGDGAFMVLSLPVSAFRGVDSDGDGRWSAAELSAHAAAIEDQVRRGVQLLDAQGARPLQGLLLQHSPEGHGAADGARQVVVLGRFALGVQRTDLRLRSRLFGTAADEQSLAITLSQGSQAQRLVLTPGHDTAAVLPAAWRTAIDHLRQGLLHVLAGADHLLFLLVVLASGWGLRRVAGALTAFTLGHGLTLAASAWGWVTVPAAVVEPAIAATIVGMALPDRWSDRQRRRGAQPLPEAGRLALVWACALVHGLGLAGALDGLGLDAAHRLWSLAGFNLGVELAQVGVAVGVALCVAAWVAVDAAFRARWGVATGALQPSAGRSGPSPAVASLAVGRWASLAAVGLGSLWFVQRLL